MTRVRSLLSLVFLGLFALQANAQIDVKLQMARKNYVAGEAIAISVSITNHSGQDLVLSGDGRNNWIDFTLKSNRGVPMTPTNRPTYGAAKIPLGQTMSRTFNLSSQYSLQSMGNYSVYAVVRLPGQTRDGFISNRLLFNVNNAIPYWTQKVGVPGKAGETREYRVLNFNGGRKDMLYAQVINLRTGVAMQTHSLGEVLKFRKPSVTLDRSQVMHVLYLIGPTLWAHTRVGPDGSILGRDLHKRGSGSDPQLVTSAKGVVEVVNGIAYDPKAEAQARSRIRKASDRPAFIFQ